MTHQSKERIFLSPPHMSGNEQSFIDTAFKTNWLAPAGPNISGFESDICRFTKANHCLAVSSGTAALHLALMALGVQEGDEVIAPTLTFAASVNPIAYLKATPILVGSEKKTWNMCPDFLETAIKDRLRLGKSIKGIIVVHLYGMPANMDDILKLSRKYGIPIVEDAAESLGSTYRDNHTGTMGDIGIYSFNGNKIVTTSGGGALVSHNSTYIEKASHLAHQAKEVAPHYEHETIGYNYALSNVCAGIGRGQFTVLEDRIKQRRSNFISYVEMLSHIDGIELLDEPSSEYFSNRWLTTIQMNTEVLKGKSTEGLREVLEHHNIESRPIWKPMHLQPVFKDLPYYGDNYGQQLLQNGLCLPSGSSLSTNELEEISTIIRQYLT